MSNGNGYFQEHRNRVRLDWELVEAQGLRRAQLGAAWAMGSHATRSTAPAQIVLPTGVGKTALITLAPFLVPCRRVLVIAPGRLVRDQLATAFRTLGDLVDSGVIASDMAKPAVAVANRRATEEDWERWNEADVVIGTVNVLSHGYPDVQRLPEGVFDLALFDEAHHLPAPAWEVVLTAVDAPAVLFTATPFRRDGKRLPGELVFSYSLTRAMADGVYAPVHYRRVEVADGQDPDAALADAAIERLRSQGHTESESRMLVRAGRVSDAEELVELYRARGVNLGLVTAGSTAAAMRKTIRKVDEGELEGFACVGSLVEGFDFPKLKIAAYHRPHRSLAPTLQFVGRLARAGQGADGELLAIPEQVQGETRELYEEDRAWRELLPEIVDAAVLQERLTRQYIQAASIDGPVEIPPLAIAPPKSARIYRTGELELDLNVHLGTVRGTEVVSRFYDAPTHLVAFVTRRIDSPRWFLTDALDAVIYDLHVVCWVAEQRTLFVSTDSAPALKALLTLVGAEQASQIGAEDLSRLLWAAEIDTYHSVGMRETRPGQASRASYRMVAGRSAGQAVTPMEAHGSALGHVIGRPREAQGRGTVGFSVKKAKLWEPDNAGSYLGFREWCEERAMQLTEGAVQTGGAPHLDIPLGDTYDAFRSHPVAAHLDHELFLGEVVFTLDGTELHPAVLDIDVERVDAETISVVLRREDREAWSGTQDSRGSFVGGGELTVARRDTGELVDVEELLSDNAPLVFFADGSAIQGALRVPPRRLPGGVPDGTLRPVAWEGVDITVEFGDAGERRNVHQSVMQSLADEVSWVVTDHGSWELADFIGIAQDGEEVVVTLVHCKSSSSASGGTSVDELYEVLGQAARSARWAYAGAPFWAELARRLRDRNACRVVAGDEEGFQSQVEAWEADPPRMRFEIHAVQPGLRADQVPGWDSGSLLILNTHLWCQESDATFVLVCQ
jgi:superfamily II DNA or RNA helicase